MKHLNITLIIFTLVLTACTSTSDNPTSNQPSNTEEPALNNPDEPVTSETVTAPQADNFSPSPADAKLTRDTAFIDSVELLTLESYPLQFMLSLEGSLPTPCNQLRISVSPPDAENKINIDVYSVTDADVMCIQVLAPFAVNYSLGSYPSGLYSVWVNSVKIAEFQS